LFFVRLLREGRSGPAEPVMSRAGTYLPPSSTRAGTWVHMPANLKHSIEARTPVVMLRVLLK
jgi:hypothetical protein